MTQSVKSLSSLFLVLLILFTATFLVLFKENTFVSETRQELSERAQIQSQEHPQAPAFDFIPHKALYEIKLAGVKSGTQILNISGQMFYEYQPSCEGWLSDHRFNMLYEYADTPPMRVVSNFSSYEAYDGGNLDFTSQRKSNGEILEEIRGAANKKTANYILPSPDMNFDMPEGALFPIAHTMAVARQIENGQKFGSAILFDGSDTEGPVEVTSFVGEKTAPPPSLTKQDGIDTALLKAPAHKVRLAFFPMKDDQVAADYEMDIIFHKNGIISDMLVEYDDFSVSQKLIALEKLDAGCEGSQELDQSQN